MVTPPSATMISPVMKLAAGDARNAASFITGEIIVADGGVTIAA